MDTSYVRLTKGDFDGDDLDPFFFAGDCEDDIDRFFLGDGMLSWWWCL